MGACQLSHTAKQTVRMNVGICQLSHTAKQTVQTQNIFILRPAGVCLMSRQSDVEDIRPLNEIDDRVLF